MSKIEWTNSTWNPVSGCTPISPGCVNCYAKKMAFRLRGRYGYKLYDPFGVTIHEDKLETPLLWSTPRMIFVCSMGDLFHDQVYTNDIKLVFSIMEMCRHHTFQVLTKRPHRMVALINNNELKLSDNIWLGVSAENQKYFDIRWRVMEELHVDNVLFVSCEPLLSDINFNVNIKPNWVIVGGETGQCARRMDLSWARHIRDQCADKNIPFFFKKAGKQETPCDLLIRQYPV